MAGQNNVFKLVSLFSNCKIVLANRTLVLASQPSHGLKKATLEKIKTLPEKPKRPTTPFIKFYEQHFQVLRKENPNIRFPEAAKKVSLAWKDVGFSVKEKFEKDYKDELVTYNEKLEKFNELLTDEHKEIMKQVSAERKQDKKRRTIRKFNKDNNRPKRPPTTYMLFALEYLKSKNLTMRKGLSEAAAKWKELPEPEKTKYNEKYLAMKKKFDEELSAWTAKITAQESQGAIEKKGSAKKDTVTELEKAESQSDVSNNIVKAASTQPKSEDLKTPEPKTKDEKKKGFLKRIFKL